jgi:hypothetical protein
LFSFVGSPGRFLKRRNLSTGPTNKALRLRLGAEPLAFRVRPEQQAAERENLHVHIEQLTIIGFTGSDAEAHYTPNGTLVTTLSVATKESWKDADGNWQSRTDWHRVVSFSKLAEYTRTLTKGIIRDSAGCSPEPRV